MIESQHLIPPGVPLRYQNAETLVPRHNDFDKLHSALVGDIPFLFPHRPLPLLEACRRDPRDVGVLGRFTVGFQNSSAISWFTEGYGPVANEAQTLVK
jgi:hypothetical protein